VFHESWKTDQTDLRDRSAGVKMYVLGCQDRAAACFSDFLCRLLDLAAQHRLWCYAKYAAAPGIGQGSVNVEDCGKVDNLKIDGLL